MPQGQESQENKENSGKAKKMTKSVKNRGLFDDHLSFRKSRYMLESFTVVILEINYNY